MIKRVSAVLFTAAAIAGLGGAASNPPAPLINFVSPTLFSCTEFATYEDVAVELTVAFKNGLKPNTVKVYVNGNCLDLRKTFIRPSGFTRTLTRRDSLQIGDKGCEFSHLTNTIKVKGRDYTGCDRQSAFQFFYVTVPVVVGP